MQKNRLPAVAQVLEAISLASSTGKFETLGSNFSQETRRGYWRPPLQLGKSYKNYFTAFSETTSSWYKADLESLLPISEFMNFTRLFTAVTESPIKVGKMNA